MGLPANGCGAQLLTIRYAMRSPRIGSVRAQVPVRAGDSKGAPIRRVELVVGRGDEEIRGQPTGLLGRDGGAPLNDRDPLRTSPSTLDPFEPIDKHGRAP